MGDILNRFSDIMKSNVHAMLDKVENPEKMLDQGLRNARTNLAEVKEATKKVMADEAQAKENYDRIKRKADEEHQYALTYIKKGDEATAAKFLESEKKIRSQELAPATERLEAATLASNKMKQMHNKLVDDIRDMEAELNNIKGELAQAKTMKAISNVKDDGRGKATFDKYKDKAHRQLLEAQAGMDLNKGPVDELEALRNQAAASATSLDDDLAALRAEAGLGGNS